MDKTPLPSPVRSIFGRIATRCAYAAGAWQSFLCAVILIVAWVIGGFRVGFLNDTWQLLINTVTTIITFLMVFLIQHAANRDTAAIHAKLDELLRALEGADNTLIAAERKSMEQIEAMRDENAKLTATAGARRS